MTTKEYLQQYLNLEKIIKIMKAEIKRKREDLQSIPGLSYDRTKVQGSPKDALTQKIAALAAEEEKLKARIVESETIRRKIVLEISDLNDARHVEILKKIFIEGKRMATAADEMGYSEEYLRRVYFQAIKEFETIREREQNKTKEN